MIVRKKGDKMEEYYEIVKDILNNEEFIKRKTYRHHGNITVYDHCLRVSIMAYKISKRLKLGDYKEADLVLSLLLPVVWRSEAFCNICRCQVLSLCCLQ